jgi:hypothetical protein
MASIMVMPRALIRRYNSSISSTRGVRWLMCVVRTPAMSAATADTRASSSCQPRSIGSRDSAKADTAAATNRSARVESAPPSSAMRRASAISAGSNNCRAPMNRSTRSRKSGEKNRASAVASIEVNTRNGLRANSPVSIGRNAVDTTGTGEAASRKS